MSDPNERIVMLYAWHPRGYGSYSFFVAARSEDEAIAAVKKHIEEDDSLGSYETDGWGTDYYKLTVHPVGVATRNAND